MSAKGLIMIVFGLSIILAASGSIAAQEPKAAAAPPATAPASTSGKAPETMEQSVAKLAEQLKRHPVQPKESSEHRHGIYLLDIQNGDVTLIADQPAPGLNRCVQAVWSHNGRRILFEATPDLRYDLSRVWSIAAGEEGRPVVSDVGAGNCPTLSPDDDRIAINSNDNPQQMGVSIVDADGSNHRFLGDYGKPIWSPDGRQLLVMSFGVVKPVRLMDADPNKSVAVAIPEKVIYADPSWTGPGTFVTVIGSSDRVIGEMGGDEIVLIDVSDPPHFKVKEVLWRKANENDLKASFPVYSATIGRCIFVGTNDRGSALYSIQKGKNEPPKRIGPDVFVPLIVNLAQSPDGRYLLYSVKGPDWRRGGAKPAVRDAAKAVPPPSR